LSDTTFRAFGLDGPLASYDRCGLNHDILLEDEIVEGVLGVLHLRSPREGRMSSSSSAASI
jgi:hypothetical protein